MIGSNIDWHTVLSSLDREAFNRFIFNMWSTDNASTEISHIELCKVPELGKNVLEQRKMFRESIDSSTSRQQFNLIVPFFQPIELLLAEGDLHLFLNRERDTLKEYNKLLKKRTENWFFPQDGEFNRPNILFVSNIGGLERQLYFDKILPKLSKLASSYEYFSNIGLGTYDSFLDQVPDKTELVLRSMFSVSPTELSFVFDKDKILVEQHISEGFLTRGVLPGSLTPCDTVLKINSKANEIFREFEAIINGRSNEAQLEHFISRYYQEIFGGHYDRIETQLWLKFPELDINRKDRRLDIFLRNAVEKDWEIMELKSNKRIISTYRGIPKLSSEITGSISQLRNYERILQQDSVKKKFAMQGIEYYEPQLRLVIGSKPDISQEQWRRIKKENENGLKITTASDLLLEMQHRYGNVTKLFDPLA